jgi:hypothetical protein
MLRRSRKIYVFCPAFDYLACGTEIFADALDELPISFGRYCEKRAHTVRHRLFKPPFAAQRIGHPLSRMGNKNRKLGWATCPRPVPFSRGRTFC